MKPVVALSLTILACAGIASARGGFETMAFKVMKLERISSSALAKGNCQICHVKPSGDAPWNSFGLAVGFWRGKKQTVPDAIYSALRYGGDSDRDGYPNTLEKLAGTDVASRDDKPNEKLDDLKKRFDDNFKLEADSDADSYPDALEVLAGTLPGDVTSKPNQSQAELLEQLTKLGGVSYFQPTIK